MKQIKLLRLAVIGSPGSGKSTLAKRLGEKLDLPVMHLDKIFWHGKWNATTEDVWRDKVKGLCGQEKWIIDGDYFDTMKIRLEAADTIVFLNVPRYKCMYRLIKRMIVSCGKARSDMGSGCIEKPSWSFIKFLKFVWDYHRYKKPIILDLLKSYDKKRIYILKSSIEINEVLKSITVIEELLS